MKLGWLARAATLCIASLLSVVAAAQNSAPTGQLDIPANVTVVGQQDPGIRKATAIVNSEVITGSDIDQRMALIVASQPDFRIPPEEMERFRAQILRNLIDETLQIQAAQQQEIEVPTVEVDNYFERVAQQGRRTAPSFAAFLRSVGSSERSLKRQIRAELAWQRLQRRWIEPFVTVGDEEVNRILEGMRTRRGSTEYHMAEIYLSATPETAQEVQTNVTRIVQQIRAGASFQAYARQFSEASSAAAGGDLGWLRLEQMPAEFAAIAQEMPVGAISNPIQVSGGYSLVLMVDKRQILVADPRDAVLSLIQISLVNPAGTTEAQAQATARRLGEATQSGGCGRARETATGLGAEIVSNDQVRVRDLPPLVQQMMLNLGVGQATPAFGSIERVSVLVLCGRDDPQVAAEPSFEEVANREMERRVSQRAQRYLRDLRRDAVVDYR